MRDAHLRSCRRAAPNKGRRNAYIGVANSIKVGELEFKNCPVEVMERRSVADEDGLIGADVFEDFLVYIDFPNEKLKLSELPKRPGQPEPKLALKSEDDDPDEDAAAPGDKTKSADAAQPVPSSGSARSLHCSRDAVLYSHLSLWPRFADSHQHRQGAEQTFLNGYRSDVQFHLSRSGHGKSPKSTAMLTRS
jgi:hypothetical protein